MIIQPKIRGFICMNAHPQGCKTNIDKQIEFVNSQRSLDGPKNVLVIGLIQLLSKDQELYQSIKNL